jgi:glutamate synthase domain-containing protein 3
VREILAALGLTRLADLVGRTDLLERRAGVAPSVDLAGLLGGTELATREAVRVTESTATPRAPNQPAIGAELLESISPQFPLAVSGPIANTDRAFGVGIAGEIAARFGDSGLPDGSVQLSMIGSAGQSAGAFMVPGMRLALVGDANDGLGKGMHGGEIVVAPAARERGRANQVLVGNAALYGATGGRLFVAGSAGERFAVRNSGATAVVEGVGDHACEYMTGGLVVVLGKVGLNFAAGMTGGVVYIGNGRETLASRTHPQQLAIDTPTLAEQNVLRELLETHESLTGSRVARALLRHDRNLAGFCRVTPIQSVAVAVTPRLEVESVAQAV